MNNKTGITAQEADRLKEYLDELAALERWCHALGKRVYDCLVFNRQVTQEDKRLLTSLSMEYHRLTRNMP